MTKRTLAPLTALMASLDLPEGDDVPDFVHLLPVSDGAAETNDARGPYFVRDAEAMIAASLAPGQELQIDENHAEDKLAGTGGKSPALGWITELQARADGIWGRVRWNKFGRELVSERAYRAMSPVIVHDENKTILRILRASLVNRPNFRGLAALNMETTMDPMEELAELLGLDAGASPEQLIEAVKAMKAAKADAALAPVPALQAALPEEITSLHAEIAELTTQLNAVTEGQARNRAEAYVDGEIRKGRSGVKPSRERFITMHMADAANAEAVIGGLPILGPSGALVTPPAARDGEVSLNAAQLEAANALGISAKDYAATLKADRANEEDL